MEFFCVIPAREKSKRLPRKLLYNISGKPVILYTVSACLLSKAKKVFVATDSKQIKDNLMRFFHSYNKNKLEVHIVKGKEIKSGSDRVGKLIKILSKNYRIPEVVVNVQGDEPLITPSIINSVALSLMRDKNADICTYGFWSSDPKEINNPNRVKIVVDSRNYAIYFSRSPVPYGAKKFIIHAGIYAFRLESLYKFLKTNQSVIEKVERLEQLRAIDNGMKIKVVIGRKKLFPVDTPEDLKIVEKILRSKSRMK